MSHSKHAHEPSVPWVAIKSNLDPGEAMIMKSRLDSEGIAAVIQQEAVGSVLGLTIGPMGSAKILVPEPLAEQALALLDDTFEDELGGQADSAQ